MASMSTPDVGFVSVSDFARSVLVHQVTLYPVALCLVNLYSVILDQVSFLSGKLGLSGICRSGTSTTSLAQFIRK